MRHTFTLNSPPGVNEWTVQFKQHLTIPAEAKIQFNFINLKLTPTSGYLEIPYVILTDIPIKTFFGTSVGSATNSVVENNLLVYVPLQNQQDQNLDDPGALPTMGGFSYEPHQPLIHEINGSEIQLNSMNFRLVDGDTLVPIAVDEIVNVVVSFTLYTEE